MAAGREFPALGALLGGGLGLAAAGPASLALLAAALRSSLELATRAEPSPGVAIAAAARTLALAGAGPLLSALAGAILAGLLQTGFLLAPAALAPRWERLDPSAGLRRLLAPARAAELLLGLLRAGLCLAAGGLLLAGAAPALAGLPRLQAVRLPAVLRAALGPLLLGLAAAAGVSAGADLLLARLRHARSLRMTRDEVRREGREEDGDPRLRAERRRTHQALAAAGPISGAAVLVVNPTRLAVALAHRRGSGDPPVVLAKGSGPAAVGLRVAARRAGVPIVHDVALARSLHRLAEVGEAIPEELYQAAAAILVRTHRMEADAGAVPGPAAAGPP